MKRFNQYLKYVAPSVGVVVLGASQAHAALDPAISAVLTAVTPGDFSSAVSTALVGIAIIPACFTAYRLYKRMVHSV